MRANSKVLLQPIPARAIVRASNEVGADMGTSHGRTGAGRGHDGLDAKRWLQAVGELRDRAGEESAGGLDAAKTCRSSAIARARLAPWKIAADIAERALWERDEGGRAL